MCVSIARVLRMTVITVYEGRPSEGDEKKIIIINKTTAEKEVDPGEFMTFDFIMYTRYIYLYNIYLCVIVYRAFIKANPPPRAGPDFRSSGIADARSTLMCFPVYTL